MKRSEQLKECCQRLLANSAPDVLTESKSQAYKALRASYDAASQIASIFHRDFEQDLELIVLSEKLCSLQTEYIQALYDLKETKDIEQKLLGFRKYFTIKCDMYSSAEWRRIKKETQGKDTLSSDWIAFYAELEEKFTPELHRTIAQYNLQEDLASTMHSVDKSQHS